MKIEDIQELLTVLDLDPEVPEPFASTLCRAMKLLSISDKEVAHRFDESEETVARWKTGSSYPSRFTRPHVYEWLKTIALASTRPSNPPVTRILDISVICHPSSELKA